MILLNISDFCDSQHREGITFVVGINEITFTHVLYKYMAF